MKKIIVGITGASGIVLGVKCVNVLISCGVEVHLVMTSSSFITAKEELGLSMNSMKDIYKVVKRSDNLFIYENNNIGETIASGSFLTDGMIIVPCSMNSVASLYSGISSNLLLRAADVTMKERRKMVLVARESPLSTTHLRNLLYLSQLGVSIIVPVPQWYLKFSSMEEVEDGLVIKMLDALDIKYNRAKRWSGINSGNN